MKAMLVTVVIAMSMVCGARAEDCAACKPGKVCPTHDGLDDTAVKDATALAREKDLQKRREAVDKLAAAAAKHLNARSKKITNELVKLLSDAEPLVKGYAAEALGGAGDEPTAAQALAAESGKFDKVLGTEKPSKDDDLRKWEEQTRLASSIFSGLGKLTTQPAAAAAIERGIRSTSPWVGKLAAENCRGFKKSKLVGRALVDMLASYFTKIATDATSAAWTAISMALPDVSGCNDIATQKDGTDAARWNSDWQKWWRANEKGMK